MKMRKIFIAGLILIVSLGLAYEAFAQVGTSPAACTVPAEIQTARPDPDGPPTPITMSFTVFDIMDIEESNQTFTTDFIGIIEWKDPRLSKQALGYSLAGCDLDYSDIWYPWFILLNQRNMNITFEEFGEVDDEGNVRFIRRGTGTLTAHYKLADFPFDEQILPITIGSARYSPDEVVLLIDEKRSGIFGGISLAGWSFPFFSPYLAINQTFCDAYHRSNFNARFLYVSW